MGSIQLHRFYDQHWELLWNGQLQGFVTPVDMPPLALNALLAGAQMANTQEEFDRLLAHWLSRNVTARFAPVMTSPPQG